MCLECVDIIEKGLFTISHINIKMTVVYIQNVVPKFKRRLKNGRKPKKDI